jgi:uroporphyrinogen decarboxylase
MPRYGLDFYAEPLAVVEGLVQAAKRDAVVVVTLYSPFMSAGHTAGDAVLTDHLRRDPEKVRRGMEIITDSLLLFVRECIRLGVDGFYHSTQGGEAGRWAYPGMFAQSVKPYDLILMEEAARACPFNILHVCDYQRDYDDLTPFLDYPGHVVNCPLKVGRQTLTPAEAARLFRRPYMGGLERTGVLATGAPTQVREAAEAVLRAAPERFVLAADCTVPSDTPWENLKTAVDAAHAWAR